MRRRQEDRDIVLPRGIASSVVGAPKLQGRKPRFRKNWCPDCNEYRHKNHEHRTEPEVVRIELKVPEVKSRTKS
jgi:hypothetical protein